MEVPRKPDFSLNKWKYLAVDKFILTLHNVLLEDEGTYLHNWCYDLGTGEWATVFFRDTKDGPVPFSMILHSEDETKTKLRYYAYV